MREFLQELLAFLAGLDVGFETNEDSVGAGDGDVGHVYAVFLEVVDEGSEVGDCDDLVMLLRIVPDFVKNWFSRRKETHQEVYNVHSVDSIYSICHP